MKASHGEGLSLEKKTVERRGKLGGDVCGLGAGLLLTRPAGGGGGGGLNTFNGLQRPEPLC